MYYKNSVFYESISFCIIDSWNTFLRLQLHIQYLEEQQPIVLNRNGFQTNIKRLVPKYNQFCCAKPRPGTLDKSPYVLFLKFYFHLFLSI